jgi:formylglycine-generating enzyme required for sulfatase activity
VEEVLNVKILLGLFAIIFLSVNLANSAESKANVKVSETTPITFTEPSAGIEMVYVKGGCYLMGDNYGDGVDENGDLAGTSVEKPVHEVCVNDFYMGKFEVTQGQWKSIMGSNPSSESACKSDNCPVDNISWNDIKNFLNKINSKNGGSTYRLPTEAEWEYAARSGGKIERYSGGNDIESVSWFDGNSGYKTVQDNPNKELSHPVGKKTPNGLGIYDMSGNVWEMTNDWYESEYYSKSPRNNPTGPTSGTERVKRGGCATGWPVNSRASRRSSYDPDTPNWLNGFRLVRIP